MENRNSIHVVPNPDGGWDVKPANAEALKHFELKAEAEDYAREVSRERNAELVIHGLDGRIQRADSHGPDPYPPEG